MSAVDTQRVSELLMSWGGRYGVVVTTNPSGYTTGSPWSKIVAKGAVTALSITGNWSGTGAVTAMADGEAIYGRFTAITATGVVYLHCMHRETVT